MAESVASAPQGPRFPVRGAAWVMATLAVLLGLFLLVGWLLPGRWEAGAEVEIAAPPAEVFPWIDTVALWERWTPWPEGDVRFHGPPAGEGAGRSWEDPAMGEGRFTVVTSRSPRELVYRVDVEGGSIGIDGRLLLDPVPGGTRVRWLESGNFGANPLLGWMALSMDRMQGRELLRSLERLREVVEVRGAGAPSPGGPRSSRSGA